jgi:hypothetical protein
MASLNPVLADTPKLIIPNPFYDFGQIPEGQTVEHLFILKNTGKAPLGIISVTPDCNCTRVRLSAVEIKPGQQVELKITFDPQGQSGSFTKLIIIETNDPAEPVKMIKYKGTVLRKSEKDQ